MSYSDCILSTGLPIYCKDGIGGVSKIYLSTYSGSTTWTVDADNTITGVTSYNPWKEVEVRIESADIASTGTHTSENGTTMYESLLNVTLHNYNTTVRDFLYTLSLQDLFAIVQTAKGDYLLIGKYKGAELSASEVTTGRALTDRFGASFTLRAKERYAPQFVDSSVINTINPTL